MADGLDVIIVDDEPLICDLLTSAVKSFYTWGNVLSFTDAGEAVAFCRKKEPGVIIFILDVFIGRETAFSFLNAIADKFPVACEDTIIVTGHASDDVVNMCVASKVAYLIEKPIRTYSLRFAVMSIVSKYIRFAKKLLEDPELAQKVTGF